MHRPIHFELHSADPAKALAFFQTVFGWKAQKWEGPQEYWLLTTGDGPGINGGLMRSRDGQPRTVNTIEVPDLDAAIDKIKAAGGQIVVPRMPIRGVGYLAYATEPTGNLLGIMHHDPSAP